MSRRADRIELVIALLCFLVFVVRLGTIVWERVRLLPGGCPPDCLGVDLASQDMAGFDLSSANLGGSGLPRAGLRGADLSHADLSEANLWRTDLRSAELSGAMLRGADMREAMLAGATLDKTDLSGADLSSAVLTGLDLTTAILNAAVLDGARLAGVDLTGADLRGARLKGADLSGARMSEANLAGAQLDGADLSGADLTGAILNGASLDQAILAQTIMVGTNLEGASLRASLYGTELRGANMAGANLFEAELAGANLSEVILDDAILISANLRGVDLQGVDLAKTRLLVDELSETESIALSDLNKAGNSALGSESVASIRDVSVSGLKVEETAVGVASGPITLYTSIPDPISRQIRDRFEASHPRVTVTIITVPLGQATDILLSQHESGVSVKADLVWIRDPSLYEELKSRQLLQRYDPHGSAFIPPNMKDPGGYYHFANLSNTILAYNLSLNVPPEGWLDLNRARYYAVVGFRSPVDVYSVEPVVQTLVDTFGWEYFEDLHDANAVVAPDNATLVEELTQGRIMVAFLVDYVARIAQEGGAPIGQVWPKEGVVSIPNPVAILTTSQNPEAAQAFLDFLLSKEGQRALVKLGDYTPVRMDVNPPQWAPPLDEVELLPDDLEVLLGDRQAIKDRWIEIFGE